MKAILIKQLIIQAFKAGEQFGNSWECSGCDNDKFCAIHGPDDVQENIIEKLLAEVEED